MYFRALNLKGIYRTATDSLLRDFYLPSLSRAVRYDRAVGFFSSSMLAEAALGLSGLIRNGGRMRLLIGHPLSDEDWLAVKHGESLRAIEAQLARELAAMLERAGGDRTVYSFELLSWMVATGSIDIRYAFRKGGMYHEKIGVMTDASGDRLVFHGSANESANALLPYRNFESLAVYPSWKKEVFSEYGAPFADGFEGLWDNRTPDVYSVAVPSDFYEQLLKVRKGRNLPPDLDYEEAVASDFLDGADTRETPRLPRSFFGATYKLKKHQEDALASWMANAYSGIFALSTGSGKTVTVLHAASRFSEQGYPFALVVAVPYQILGEQWSDVMEHFGIRPIKAFYSREWWKSRLEERVSALIAGGLRFLAVVVVNDTLASEDFQRILAAVPRDKLFFVGDECHHHSSSVWLSRAPVGARFRIGLSATPWNPGREDHRRVLEEIYGPVVATYSLGDALADGVLCQYAYEWVPCQFESDEAEEYERLSLKMAALYAQDPTGTNPSVQTQIQATAARRARLVGALRDKLRQLQRLVRQQGPTSHTLFYCGEGSHPLDDDTGPVERAVDATIQMLASMGWKVGRITAAEAVSERKRILESFDDGVIDAVAAIRVLDEGFDIPSCRKAYVLASSTSYRQYVQRRGRVLRRSPGKESAVVYDFSPIASKDLLDKNKTVWRRQTEMELARIRDFVALARNGAEQQVKINDAMGRIGLGAIYYEAAPVAEEELYGT